MNSYAIWFGRLVLMGVLVNLFLALPAIWIPNAMLAFIGQEPDLEHPIWPSFASLLLCLLSLFYLPAAIDLFRYTINGWLAVLSRFAGAVFFLLLHQQYLLFGYLDLTLGLVQLPLLIAALYKGPLNYDEALK